MTHGSVCIVQLSATGLGKGVRSKARRLGCPGQLVKAKPYPRILFGLRVGLNNANLRPLFWNVMKKK